MKKTKMEKAYLLVEVEYRGEVEDDDLDVAMDYSGIESRPMEFDDLAMTTWTGEVDRNISDVVENAVLIECQGVLDANVSCSVMGLLKARPRNRLY